ncbi:hypothetical protein [Dysgonomonas sp. BGC7]|uniref:hypothetical protein n=1 Tax=Dysgonomonas sp. BGC7 TaxID=1658008 RepID=UPI00068170A6|nr:hypothetical protein [Dysgonomonas sp. BGC7]MBD8389648.1 hypothetical protein [Dysgonomonas sp. BGC7]
MNFKYSCIGDNTPENREWLEKLGYKDELQLKHPTPIIVITSDELTQYAQFYTSSIEKVKEAYPDLIDCTGNDELFRAVTAMRDDSDYMQWFTDGVKWTLCYEENISKWRDIYNFRDKSLIHKATLEELINHFSGFHHKSEV